MICFQIFLWQDLQQPSAVASAGWTVVICFQIFLWQDLQQQSAVVARQIIGCDLLSDFSLTRFTTTINLLSAYVCWLWFAFRFFFDKIYNNEFQIMIRRQLVVICFQIFLWQDLQQQSKIALTISDVVICFQIFLWQDLQQLISCD